MCSVDGTAVVFNGEIYNHQALRSELSAAGVAFLGRSDTEVILQGFLQWGTRVFDRLEGMFAVAVSDGRTLHLARDDFGMKPLFYWVSPDQKRLVFGSTVRSLLCCRDIPRDLNGSGLIEHLVFGHTLANGTLLQAIQQVGPGERIRIAPSHPGIQVSHKSRTPEQCLPPPRSRAAAVDELVSALARSVQHHASADHPVGVLLSGGLDSTTVAAFRQGSAGVHSFVVADSPGLPDLAHAAAFAQALGLQHHELLLRPPSDSVLMTRAVKEMAAPRLPTVSLVSSAEIRSHTKAALCGEGADELFAGYPVHREPGLFSSDRHRQWFRLKHDTGLPERVLRSTAKALASLRSGDLQDQKRALYNFLLTETMPQKHLLIWDRGAMASGLEIRMPFLDPQILALAQATLDENLVAPPKALVYAALERVAPTAVAAQLRSRGKTACPDALRRTHRRLRDIALESLPRDWRRHHPLRSLCRSPLELVLLDLYLLSFLRFGGDPPAGLTVETMYDEHKSPLAQAHEACQDSLFASRE
jgi:asparagine synthase (glutamine-hydrolysing)